MTTNTNAIKTKNGMLMRYARLALLTTIALTAAFTLPTTATAAPVFGITMTPTPKPIPVYGAIPLTQGDRVFDYTLEFTNTGTPSAGVGVGDTLSCSQGNWSNPPISSYSYRWKRNGVDIPGASGPAPAFSSYTVVADDQGTALQCVVSATNGTAPNEKTGQSVGNTPIVIPATPGGTAPAAPINTGIFSLGISPAGSVAAGTQLTCPVTGWSNSPTVGAFKWYRNGNEIAGATAATYVVTAADVVDPSSFQCSEVATVAGPDASMGTSDDISVFRGLSAARITATPPSPILPFAATSNAPVATAAPPPPTTVTVVLPSGMVVDPVVSGPVGGGASGWNDCDYKTTPGTVTCTRAAAPAVGVAYPPLKIAVNVGGSVSDEVSGTATISGGGAAVPASVQSVFTLEPARPFGVYDFSTSVLDVNGDDETRAGAHPYSASTSFKVNAYVNGAGILTPVEDPKTISLDLPPGFVGNPANAPTCKSYEMETGSCPVESQVGVARSDVLNAGPSALVGVYNIEARKGHPAEFAFNASQVGIVHLFARVRSDGDYGITVDTPYTTQARLLSASFTLWGVPADSSHDALRCFPGNIQCNSKGASSDASKLPFLSNLTECSEQPPVTTLRTDSWQNPGDFKSHEFASPLMTGCMDLEFDPSIVVTPKTSRADSPSGYKVHLHVPQTNDVDSLATPPLKDATVTLPAGVSISPGAAGGLEGCSDSQLGLGSSEPASCPEASKIGKVHVATPVLPERDSDYLPNGPGSTHYQLSGDVFVRKPDPDARREGLFAIFLDIEDDQTGVVVKLRGNVVPDEQTGQLTARFTDNPQLPFTDFLLEFKQGPRAPLANPAACGPAQTTSTLTSWGGPDAAPTSAFDVDWDGNGGACPATQAFTPSFTAGTVTPNAGISAPFALRIGKPDQQPALDGVDLDLPEGLLANLRGNIGQRIGTVRAAAGTGSSPFWLSGPVVLEGPYGDAPFSLRVTVPAVAGPFDLGDVVVRQKIYVDRTDAHVTVVSDPIPTIVEGVPVRLQNLAVDIDKPGFMLNPTDCTTSQIDATLHTKPGATAAVSDRFQIGNCADLPFKPRLALTLTGKRQVTTGKHPGVKALVRQTGIGEAGIEKAIVRLPKSLALDPENAQALCEFEDGTKPDLENHCPPGSIVGRARAKTPLLNNDLVGNVYFVKNVRKDPTTGNLIRTLPMLVVALRGEIAINLKGESSTAKNGRLINTFASVPDAPITQFNLNIQGAQNGILAVTRTRKSRINLCATRQIAEADLAGQNGRQHDTDVRIKTPCTKQAVKRAKRAAVKQAAKRS